jgi:predicted transcriptional regulator
MELKLADRQTTELCELASRTGPTPGQLVEESVDRMLNEDRWLRDQVQPGIDQVARGEFLEEEEMDQRVARLLQTR